MNTTTQASPTLAIVAVLGGLGMLLVDFTTGLISQSLPAPLTWASYLALLMASIWGMKTLLEAQNSGISDLQLTKDRNHGRLKHRHAPTRNLWKLPAEGQMYLLMLVVLLLGALFGKTNTLMLMFALMAGPFIVNGGVTFAMTRRLSLQRQLPERAMAGEMVSVDITVINRKRILSSCLVSVEDRLLGPREMLTGKLIFAQIPPRNSRTGRYQARFVQRGRYRLGPARLTSRFPLGIVERGLQVEAYDDILIYPRTGTLSRSWKRQLTDGQEMSRSNRGRAGAHQDEFHRIREYRPGDELRSIHWKTSARRNELMVREFRQNRDRRLVLMLDLWKPGTGDEASQQARIEHAASLATTIGWEFIQDCGAQQFDLICLGEERHDWLSTTRADHQYGWLDCIALAEAGQKFDANLIQEEVLKRQNATTRCVIVTTRPWEELQSGTDTQTAEAVANSNLMLVEADPEKTSDFFQLD